MAGLASVKTSQGDLLASPCYQAPELIDGAPDGVDGRADQFSLAVTGYQMLSGLSPFASVGILHTLEKVRRFIPQSLDSICSDVPHPVAAVFARAMSKNREARFPCMLSFIRALNEATAAPIASLDRTSSMPTIPFSLNDSRLVLANGREEECSPKQQSTSSQVMDGQSVTAPIDGAMLRDLLNKANMPSGKHSVAPVATPTAAVGLKVGTEVVAPEETATSASVVLLPSAQQLQSRGDSLPGVRVQWPRWSLVVGPLFGICLGAVLAQLLIGGLGATRFQSAGSSGGQLSRPAQNSLPAALQEDNGEPSSSQPGDATRLPGNDSVHPAVYPGDSLPLRLADPLGPVPTTELFPQPLRPRALVAPPPPPAGELGPIPNYRR
jgi:serine/threonine protein kinase